MRKSNRGALRRAGLTKTNIEVLAWRFCDGLSLEAIGDLLGCAKQSVAKRIRISLRRLAEAGLPLPDAPPRTGDIVKRVNVSAKVLDEMDLKGGRAWNKSERGKRLDNDDE